jgi:hypothetical protein
LISLTRAEPVEAVRAAGQDRVGAQPRGDQPGLCHREIRALGEQAEMSFNRFVDGLLDRQRATGALRVGRRGRETRHGGRGDHRIHLHRSTPTSSVAQVNPADYRSS